MDKKNVISAKNFFISFPPPYQYGQVRESLVVLPFGKFCYNFYTYIMEEELSLRIYVILFVFLLSSLTIGCTQSHTSKEAVATLIDSKGMNVGTVKITENHDGVQVNVKAQNLPAGSHAFHIHAVGKCSAPDFKSAGPHFNPAGKQHGHLNPQGNHAGDLGNITVKSDGTFELTKIIDGITLESGSKNSLFQSAGTAFVIHEKPDDEKTDPTGNAGKRIACGVVKASK
jgi:superoxide dismutase, Cu-Zn family